MTVVKVKSWVCNLSSLKNFIVFSRRLLLSEVAFFSCQTHLPEEERGTSKS